jgi:acetyl esterase/lipase
MSAPAYATAVSQPLPLTGIASFLEVLNSAGGPPMETTPPAAARAVLEGAQKGASLPPAEVTTRSITVDGAQVPLFIVRPPGSEGKVLPVFIFIHGGGWVLGDFPTHERLVRDLVTYSGAAAVHVEYTRSPEAKYPTALNQIYAATKWVAEHGAEIGVDGTRLALVGNSVGGNMTTATALRCKKEGGPQVRLQVLFWPVTDATFDTPSYHAYAEKHFLTRNMMKWFWDSYTTDAAARAEIYASPLRASLEELAGLPPALVQTAELDVLRDEGEAYARKLNLAGVEVTHLRIGGVIHDYGLLNPISQVPAVQAALRQAGNELKRRLA